VKVHHPGVPFWGGQPIGSPGIRQKYEIVKSAGSRSTRIGVGKEGPEKTSGVAMAQKNPRSQAALVLIVDDDEAVVEITAEILGTLGYDVLIARNGPEAVELLRRNSCVSVLFTDIQMPGMGGEELAAIALMLRPRIRVVFTSGFQTPPPNAAFIPKPYKAVDLIRVLPPQPLT
jgi:CheY-like chemotaxis protein